MREISLKMIQARLLYINKTFKLSTNIAWLSNVKAQLGTRQNSVDWKN